MARRPFYVAALIADRFATWCRIEGVDPTKTVEEILTHLATQPTQQTSARKSEARKPWEVAPFYGDALTSKWSRDQELLNRLKLVRDLHSDTDQGEPLARALLAEIQRLERVLNLSSVRYRGEGGA